MNNLWNFVAALSNRILIYVLQMYICAIYMLYFWTDFFLTY